MTAPLWRRRAVLLSGLGLAAASLSSQVRLSWQRQVDSTASTINGIALGLWASA